MCGINGIFAYHYAANAVDRGELLRTRDHMAVRGPDGKGEWVSKDGRVALGHRRLSIIDLSEMGAQPMTSVDGTLVATFNGEIYNYVELRRRLEAKGRIFRSNSDTEVLLQLYAEKGEEMVRDLRGMFAFGIWDDQRGELFLARDPYGIKPLYYADDGWTFRFASQVKALVAGGAVSKDLEPAGLVGFHLWGSVPEPFTTHREIRALPAGTLLKVKWIGAKAPSRYYSIGQVVRDGEAAAHGQGKPLGEVELQEQLRQELFDSIKHHLVADVPIGAFLSAGIDSGSVVGMMRDAGQQDIQTVTLYFEEFNGCGENEAPLAAEVARQYGTQHSTRVVTRSEFEADLPRLLDAMDQPSVDGINTWFVSKAAREHGLKVAVSGIGGDELFGGYPSFTDIPKWVRLTRWLALVPGLGRAARSLSKPIASWLGYNPKSVGLLELGGTYAGAYLLKRGLFMPWELRNQIDDLDFLNCGLRRLDPLRRINDELCPSPNSVHGKILTLESALYLRNQLLRDSDWASMAHSLEVRMPLVDSFLLKRLARYLGAAMASGGKRNLASMPSSALPLHVVDRRKTGFVTPVDEWMKTRVSNQQRREITSRRCVRDYGRHPWARDWSAYILEMSGFGRH